MQNTHRSSAVTDFHKKITDFQKNSTDTPLRMIASNKHAMMVARNLCIVQHDMGPKETLRENINWVLQQCYTIDTDYTCVLLLTEIYQRLQDLAIVMNILNFTMLTILLLLACKKFRIQVNLIFYKYGRPCDKHDFFIKYIDEELELLLRTKTSTWISLWGFHFTITKYLLPEALYKKIPISKHIVR